MLEDSDIVKHVLNGDVDSFRILVERYQRPVLSMIRRLIWDSHRCEEIGQDVFVAAVLKLSTFDPARSRFSERHAGQPKFRIHRRHQPQGQV